MTTFSTAYGNGYAAAWDVVSPHKDDDVTVIALCDKLLAISPDEDDDMEYVRGFDKCLHDTITDSLDFMIDEGDERR